MKNPTQAFLHLVTGNVWVTAANLLRDIAIAAAFGAAAVADTFYLAISIPVFLLTVAGSACRSILVPALTRLQATSPDEYRSAGQRIGSYQVVGIGLIFLLLIAVAALLLLATNGTVSSAGSPGIAAVLLGILPMYALAAFVEVSQGPLQVSGRLFFPNLLRSFVAIGMIIGATWSIVGNGLLSVAVAGTLTAAIAAMIIFLLLRRAALSPRFFQPPLNEQVSTTLRTGFVALVIANSITYANPLIDQWMAGLLGPGAVSTLGYASRLTVGVASLLAGAMSPVLLGIFSANAYRDDQVARSTVYWEMLTLVAWAGCGLALGTWLLAAFGVDLLYTRGQFTTDDAESVSRLVYIYGAQYPFWLTGIVAANMLWAQSLNRVFIPLGIVMVLAKVVLNFILMSRMDVAGIALSTVGTYLLSLMLMNIYLARSKQVYWRAAEVRTMSWPFLWLAIAALGAWWFDAAVPANPEPMDFLKAAPVLVGYGLAGIAACRRPLHRLRQMQRQVA